MSVQEQITRLSTAAATIKQKLTALGLIDGTGKLDDSATAISNIPGPFSPSAEVREGETYTIIPGYYTGGAVTGVAGGGSYSLQEKIATPTKSEQAITPDPGKYGLSKVTINPIPAAYQDVTNVTASAADVLATKIIINSAGTQVAGTMPNNGAVSASLNTETTLYTIPAGYHNGSGKVQISLESKTATPATSSQTIEPSSGKVLSSVVINPIPGAYKDATGKTITSGDLLSGKTAIGWDSTEEIAINITGTMPDNGAFSKTLDATTNNQSQTIAAGYHNGSGKVQIVLEEKSVTPATSSQNITPTSGKVLSKVTVAAIPSNYVNSSTVDAAASNVLFGKKAVVKTGTNSWAVVTGSMPNNGNQTASFTGLGTIAGDTYYTIPAGYTSGGTVSLTDDIENLLAAI